VVHFIEIHLGVTDTVPLIVRIRERSEVKWRISDTLAWMSDQSLGYVGAYNLLSSRPDSADVVFYYLTLANL
jgi:hypothetical protein